MRRRAILAGAVLLAALGGGAAMVGRRARAAEGPCPLPNKGVLFLERVTEDGVQGTTRPDGYKAQVTLSTEGDVIRISAVPNGSQAVWTEDYRETKVSDR